MTFQRLLLTFIPGESSIEVYILESYELQCLLWSLGYTEDHVDEAEINAAVEVARNDWPQWRAA